MRMATVIAEMSMSLDGFVADASDGIEEVFAWFLTGDIEVPTADPQFTLRATSEASAGEFRDALANAGAMLHGRRTFELANGWGGQHPMGVPAFVVTHRIPDGWPREGSTVHFVTDGIESAVEQAKAAAAEKVVGVGGADVAQQCLNAGLLDGIRVNLVPVLLGDGVRFFANLAGTPVWLEDPRVVEGTRVTHLDYRLGKD
jgi:dihydrofolate reductase